MTLEEVQRDATSWMSRTQIASGEVERLKAQLETEKNSVSEMSTELQVLKTELEINKTKSERFLSTKKSFEGKRYIQSKAHIKLEDAENTIIELKEELAYKASINRSLALQLEKTIESNSELLLEIKDLDELLQTREKEIEELREQVENANFEDEKAMWMSKVEDKEREISALKEAILKLEAGVKRRSENNNEELEAVIMQLRKELGDAETESAEVRQENMNLLSQLMDLRHQTDEKCEMIRDLESKLDMAHDASLLAEKALEKKIKDLQSMVNDLREKLHLSEELSQSQLDSNKAFLEDLISRVGELQSRNEELEFLLKTSEGKNESLQERLSTLENEILEHEKERSLLLSQRGQMKTLREKIAVISEDYQASLKKIEDLGLTNMTLREESDRALTVLNQRLEDTEESLKATSAECMDLKKELEEAKSQLELKNQEVSLLLFAKGEAEASLTSLHASQEGLQEHATSLANEKQNLESSFSSLQVAHIAIKEQLQDLEQKSYKMLDQLEKSGAKVSRLTQDLEFTQNQLEKAHNQLLELESEKTNLLRRLENTEEKKMFHKSENGKLELQISCLKEDMTMSQKSFLESECKAQELQLQNDDLIEKLEASKEKEAYLENKVRVMEQALLEMKEEISELENKLDSLEAEKDEQNRGKQDLQTSLQAQVEELKASLDQTMLEKDNAMSSLHNLQNDNESLLKELTVWKEKKKIGDKSPTVAGTARLKSQKSSVQDKVSQQQDSNSKGGKKGTDIHLDQKNELMRLKKHAADLKRKLTEQEEEKEEIKKKFSLLQKEVQRKSDLLAITEKKLREKEREAHVNQKATKYPSKASPKGSSSAPQSSKTLSSLSEKVKVLEEKLNVKTVELEATKFLLKEKEEKISSMQMLVTGDSESCIDTEICQDRFEGLENGSSVYDQQHHSSTNVHSDEFTKLQAENQQLRNILAKLNRCTTEGSIAEPQQPFVDQKESHLEAELCEMRDRYSQMSLQFAELQVEKEELVMTIRNLNRETSVCV